MIGGEIDLVEKFARESNLGSFVSFVSYERVLLERIE